MADQARTLRRTALVFVCLAPLGWLMFWAVFHEVPGQDWVVFHTAAELVVTRDYRTLADPSGFTDLLNWTHRAWFPKPLIFHPWVYPPVTLLLALAFGWLPYLASLVAFLGASFLGLVAALWPWERGWHRAMLIGGVLLCPATAFTLGAGQLSFLVAAVLLGGLWLLPTAPFQAGLLLAVLALKPQFALMVPIAVLAARAWWAVLGGLAGGVLLVLASLAVAGPRVWEAWLRLASGADPTLDALMGAVRRYDQSVHTCLAMLGIDDTLAGLGQLAAFAVSAVCVWLAFARPAPPRARAVVLLCATVFGAPHVGDYDEVMPAIAAMLTLLDGCVRPWRRGEPWLAAGVWLATMFAPPALIAVLGLPILTALSALTPLLVLGLMLRAVPWRERETRLDWLHGRADAAQSR